MLFPWSKSTLLLIVVGLLVEGLSACSGAVPHQDRIAFYASSDQYGGGEVDIYAINVDGSGLTYLTTLGGASDPVWSPDGRQIAFEWTGELFVMNADKTQLKRLTYEINGEGRSSIDSPPTWSPDGQRLAFSYTEGVGYSTLYVIGADGKNLEKLYPFGDTRYPVWSPRGNRIAFEIMGDHRPSVVGVWDMDSKKLGLSGDDNPYCDMVCPSDYSPTWMPDGQRIAYSARDGEIHVMDADGGNNIRLTDVGIIIPLLSSVPVWSPDGKQVAFVSNREGNKEIYVVDADGTNLRRLTHTAAKSYSPTWSPDSKQIAFASDRDGHSEIYVMNADGSAQTRLTNSPTYKWGPAWSPR